MDNQEAAATGDLGDGSIASAVASMPDIESLEQGLPDRGDNGQFKARPPLQEEPSHEPEETEAPEPEADQEVDAAAKPAEGDAEEIDYVELPGDEGEEPTRIKLEELVERYNGYEQLQEEIENVRQASVPPEDYDQYIDQSVQMYGQLENAIGQWLHLNQVQAPDESLLQSDPDLYAAQLQHARALNGQRQDALAKLEQVKNLQAQEQERLESARWAREQRKIVQDWPELRTEAVMRSVMEDLESNYGVDAQTLAGIRDARAWRLIKDAIAYRKSQATAKKVAKAVTAKPKLVRSRGSAPPQQRARSDAMSRLSRTGSIDDAADAIGHLLD
jgi:hypothetical protein